MRVRIPSYTPLNIFIMLLWRNWYLTTLSMWTLRVRIPSVTPILVYHRGLIGIERKTFNLEDAGSSPVDDARFGYSK